MRNEAITRQEAIDLIRSMTAPTDAMTRATRASSKNICGSTGGTAPTGVTNAMNLVLGACNIKALESGLFLASFTLAMTGVTATDTANVTVTTQTSSTAISFGGATKITGSNLFGNLFPYPSPAAAYGMWVSGAAGGITFATGGGGSITQFTTGAQVAGTAATTQEFSWYGLVANSVSNVLGNPFPIGNDVALLVSLNATHSATVTYAGFSMFIQEVVD